jgi:signal transduction histidine kinase
MMGGTIYVDSVVNQGSVFMVELPPKLQEWSVIAVLQ